MKPTREEAEKLIGKRTPLPSGKGAGALNDLPKEQPKKSAGNFADPLGLKKSTKDKMQQTEDYKRGGMVRGCGAAVKGKTKGKMY